MKNKFVLILAIVFTLVFSLVVFADESVKTASVKVNVGSKTITLNVLWVNMNDPLIRIDEVAAKGGVGQVDSLKDIVVGSTNDSSVGIAGVNGTFFDAYSANNPQAQGTIITNGEVQHISNTGSMFTIDTHNRGDVIRPDIKILGSTEGQWKWPHVWYAWNINHFYSDPSAVMLFDSNYKGYKPTHTFTGVQVVKGVVTKIESGLWEIPSEGFLLLTNDQRVLEVFSIGKEAAYKIVYKEKNGNDLSTYFESVRTAVGAGPTLVSNGVKVVDPAAEGFKESKITTDRGTRTLLGITASGQLGITVVSSATVFELADIAIQLGMVDAINLDGGASSGIYANGKYLAAPGRELSNALVIKKLRAKPIRVLLNSKELLFDSEPFIYGGRTLVPLRSIAEALGAEVSWEASTGSIVMNRYGKLIKLQNNSVNANIDGLVSQMDVPVMIRDGRSFVPLRFITDAFGGTVGWNGSTQTVSLDIENISDKVDIIEKYLSNGETALAITELNSILAVDENNLYAIKTLADLYNGGGDKSRAIALFQKALTLNASDSITTQKLGWALYGIGNVQEAVRIFLTYIELSPEDSIGYYALGHCYSSNILQDRETAISYYKLSIEKGLSGESLDYANRYIN